MSFGIRINATRSKLKLYGKFRYWIKTEDSLIGNDEVVAQGVISPEDFKNQRISINFQYKMDSDLVSQSQWNGWIGSEYYPTQMTRTFRILFYGEELCYVIEKNHVFAIPKDSHPTDNKEDTMTEIPLDLDDEKEAREIAEDLELSGEEHSKNTEQEQ